MYENKTVILKLGNLTEDSTTVKKKKNKSQNFRDHLQMNKK